MVDSGLTTVTVTTPDGLHATLYQALAKLPRPESEQPLATRVWNVPALHRGFTGRRELLAKLRGPVRTFLPTVVQVLHGMGEIGKTAPGD